MTAELEHRVCKNTLDFVKHKKAAVQRYMDAVVRAPDRASLEAAKLVAREGFAWPGGCEMFLVTYDGEVMCRRCVRANFKLIAAAHRDKDNVGWRPCGADNMANRDAPLQCAHCNQTIGGDE